MAKVPVKADGAVPFYFAGHGVQIERRSVALGQPIIGRRLQLFRRLPDGKVRPDCAAAAPGVQQIARAECGKGCLAAGWGRPDFGRLFAALWLAGMFSSGLDRRLRD